MPIEGRALRDVEISDFNLPASIGVFAGNKAGKGRFAHASLLAQDRNDDCHIPPAVLSLKRVLAQDGNDASRFGKGTNE